MDRRKLLPLAVMAAVAVLFQLIGHALVANAADAPARLSDTGLFRADGSYEARTCAVESAAKSGAQASRWVKAPRGAKLDARAVNDWRLPAGTTLWQEFAANGRKVETRMLRIEADGRWTLASYVWLADQSDAMLSSEPLLPEAFDCAPRGGEAAVEISQNLARPGAAVLAGAAVAGR